MKHAHTHTHGGGGVNRLQVSLNIQSSLPQIQHPLLQLITLIWLLTSSEIIKTCKIAHGLMLSKQEMADTVVKTVEGGVPTPLQVITLHIPGGRS